MKQHFLQKLKKNVILLHIIIFFIYLSDNRQNKAFRRLFKINANKIFA